MVYFRKFQFQDKNLQVQCDGGHLEEHPRTVLCVAGCHDPRRGALRSRPARLLQHLQQQEAGRDD